MLDMGFEGTIRKMVGEMGMTAKEDRQTMMFSATFPEAIQRMAGDFMKPYLFVTVGLVSSANRDVEQIIVQVQGHAGRLCFIVVMFHTLLFS